MDEKLRLDKYLWAIRVFKTRTQATHAIDDGKVKWNSMNVKPSKPVSIGDQYDIRGEARKWTIQVTSLLYNRVGYEESLKYYTDLTSEEDKVANKRIAPSFYTGKRLSKIGRPTKKQRRDLEGFVDGDIDA
jgi:ribosome-associated heat shock protein Hsp15